MRRRNFIRGLAALGAGFTILPGAGRIWVATRTPYLDLYDEIFHYMPPVFDPLILNNYSMESMIIFEPPKLNF